MKKILVVDDSKTNLMTIKSILADKYEVVAAKSGDFALKFLEKKFVNLILLDLYMPGEDGRHIINKIHSNVKTADIPVIFLTAETDAEIESQCLHLGAYDFIKKPVIPATLLSRVEKTIELDEYRKDMEGKLLEKTKHLEAMSLQTIMTIANTIDAKDEYTKGHSQRVANYSKLIALELGMKESTCESIFNIALLHDVGKIGVPDEILKKKGPLTDDEFNMMKQHTVIGSEILKDIDVLPDISLGAKYHHERFDGKGYPQGLVGEEIPLIARIIGLADAYDAMTSNRCYRKKLEYNVVREELINCRGKQFDPNLVDIFLKIIDTLEEEKENGQYG